MRDTCATSIQVHGPLAVSLELVSPVGNGPVLKGRSMMQLRDPDGSLAMLTVFAEDDVLAGLALDLLELLPIKTIAWEQAKRKAVPADDPHLIEEDELKVEIVAADDPFGVPTTDLTAAELGAQA